MAKASVWRGVCLAGLVCVFFASMAVAEEIKVYPGEFIVEPYVLGHSTEQQYSFAGLSVEKNLGRGSLLVSTSMAALNGSSNDSDYRPTQVYDAAHDVCPSLIKSGLAKECSPNFVLSTSVVPNDSGISNAWGLGSSSGVNAVDAWDISTGSSNVVVAVIDSGIDYTHPDLANNMWVNSGEIPGNGIDDDQNGYIDDVHGINTTGSGASGDPYDDNGHGTHVAGVIGASANNGIGVAGISWKVKLMGLKFLGANGSGGLAGAVEAINYMTALKRQGVNIVVSNNSWGGGGFSQTLFNAIEASTEAGIIFVAAAGNAANDNDATASYPGGYEISGIVSVAATDRDQNLASFSNYGVNTVDIAAPGVGIYSTYPGGDYRYLSGTSMAAPHVSGVLALAAGHFTGEYSSTLLARMYASGVSRPTLTGLVRTGRTVDANRMLNGSSQPVPEPEEPETCEYEVTGGAAPGTAVNEGELLLQSDEYSFTRVELPFEFPFHKALFSDLYVSPNGLVYFGSSPQEMDYRVGDTPPLNSIAALHADLTSSDPAHGVYALISADRVVISWHAALFNRGELGAVEVFLTLHKTGEIEVHISGSQDALDGLYGLNLVGLTGPARDSSYLAVEKGATVQAKSSYGFIPGCQKEQPAVVNEIITEMINTGRRRSALKPDELLAGKTAQVTLNGEGSGVLQVGFTINRFQCPGTAEVDFTEGKSVFLLSLPHAAKRARKLTLSVTDSEHVLEKTSRIKQKRRRRGRKLSRRGTAKLCTDLLSSVY